MSNALELLEKVRSAWAAVDAPPPEDMKHLEWIAGRQSAEAFTGIRPTDVDIESSGFQAATPLLELPARAAAAYLGTYLISLLYGLNIQANVGFPTDISTRSHTIATLLASNFWTDIAGPNLPSECLEVLGEVTEFLIANRGPLTLEDDEVARLQRVIRSINRQLGS